MSSKLDWSDRQVRVPATSGNLGCGFDCMGLALALHNTVSASFSGRRHHQPDPARSAVNVEGEGADLQPADGTNLLVRSFHAVFSHRRQRAPDVQVTVRARIPVSRGLGSSAAAVAAGLCLARDLVTPELTLEEAIMLGNVLEGHPDNVLPALVGGITAAFVTPKGEVRWIRLSSGSGLCALALVPRTTLETAKARAALPPRIPMADTVANLGRVAVLAGALAGGRLCGDGDHRGLGASRTLAGLFDDRLHQPYRAPLVEGLAPVLAQARAAGALGAFLSGAGPTLLALFSGRAGAIPARARTRLRRVAGSHVDLALGLAARGCW